MSDRSQTFSFRIPSSEAEFRRMMFPWFNDHMADVTARRMLLSPSVQHTWERIRALHVPGQEMWVNLTLNVYFEHGRNGRRVRVLGIDLHVALSSLERDPETGVEYVVATDRPSTSPYRPGSGSTPGNSNDEEFVPPDNVDFDEPPQPADSDSAETPPEVSPPSPPPRLQIIHIGVQREQVEGGHPYPLDQDVYEGIEFYSIAHYDGLPAHTSSPDLVPDPIVIQGETWYGQTITYHLYPQVRFRDGYPALVYYIAVPATGRTTFDDAESTGRWGRREYVIGPRALAHFHEHIGEYAFQAFLRYSTGMETNYQVRLSVARDRMLDGEWEGSFDAWVDAQLGLVMDPDFLLLAIMAVASRPGSAPPRSVSGSSATSAGAVRGSAQMPGSRNPTSHVGSNTSSGAAAAEIADARSLSSGALERAQAGRLPANADQPIRGRQTRSDTLVDIGTTDTIPGNLQAPPPAQRPPALRVQSHERIRPMTREDFRHLYEGGDGSPSNVRADVRYEGPSWGQSQNARFAFDARWAEAGGRGAAHRSQFFVRDLYAGPKPVQGFVIEYPVRVGNGIQWRIRQATAHYPQGNIQIEGNVLHGPVYIHPESRAAAQLWRMRAEARKEMGLPTDPAGLEYLDSLP